VLRSQILYPKDGKDRRVILVTSAMEQAGKTMVACNLAVSIAQGVDPYALLIDADIRKASVHRMLGFEPAEGLSEYLQTDEPLSKYLIRTPMMKLTVLPAGHSVRNPAELSGSFCCRGFSSCQPGG
jgi:Mrp family chromosome partitioning ATPase